MQEDQYIHIRKSGTKTYYKDKLMRNCHRLDGPAYEADNGTKEWRIDGRLHRLDGPAFEGTDGYKSWWFNGNRHRLDGPAIVGHGVSDSYYIDNELLTEEQFKARTAPTLELTLEDIAVKYGVEDSKIKIVE